MQKRLRVAAKPNSTEALCLVWSSPAPSPSIPPIRVTDSKGEEAQRPAGSHAPEREQEHAARSRGILQRAFCFLLLLLACMNTTVGPPTHPAIRPTRI
ncbi:hypothetical protein EYF80_034980 [Liparis tanakae]|uniref:Uncharacterized protein n=1 Tax=Liparis tanakae TaxID=230148 RepID=A0A4Z2GPR1_9TELE|nr:hypothetical protein EYF80_034980 [Liparis tanakae]